MPHNQANGMTSIVESVAFETQKNQFRGSVFGQQGMYIDKPALQASAADFNLNDFVGNANSLHALTKANGPLRF